MKIAIEDDCITVTASADYVTATNYVDLFAGLMLALSFGNDAVLDGMRDYIERSELAYVVKKETDECQII